MSEGMSLREVMHASVGDGCYAAVTSAEPTQPAEGAELRVAAQPRQSRHNFAKSKTMILRELNILNYKNIREAEMHFADSINCFVGLNGQGKTNILDALMRPTKFPEIPVSLQRNTEVFRHPLL